jgi:N-acetylmuramoyl-L-alanine amidase
MKKTLSISILSLALLFSLSASASTPLTGKVIALDAGHGNGETGAIGKCGLINVIEADVNLAVREELKNKLVTSGANVHEIAQLPTRKERVEDAESVNSDVLISIHHNGSSNTSADYTQSFVTQKNDRDLAKPIHSALVSALGLSDKGIKNDGYGMTVYGSLPGVLTESYFITNTDAACDFIDYLNEATNTRIDKEAQAMYNGLLEYFSQPGDNGGGGNGKGRNR